jgi:cytochrome c peroxidase
MYKLIFGYCIAFSVFGLAQNNLDFVVKKENLVAQKNASNESVLLGKTLFFEKRLSKNGTRACASCHAPELAFTDGYRRSLGAEADLHQHNSPSLLNAAAMQNLTWSDSTVHTFRQQMQQPFFGKKTLEMGLQHRDTSTILRLLKQDKTYQTLFKNAKTAIAWRNIETALSDYLTTLRSDTSAQKTLNEAETRGKAVFFSTKTKCATCHPPPYYTISTLSQNAYFNIGLYQKYPKKDNGLRQITHKKRDDGKFRVPSLLNTSKTAPYMHDGSVATLSEVIAIFENGGHKNGKNHPQKSSMIQGFSLTATERQGLLAFLYSL